MEPRRRALFLPTRIWSDAPWPVFCQRLARIAHGRLDDETPRPGDPGRARLIVARQEDVHHARSLCAEFGVLLLQAGAAEPPADRACLWLDASRLAALESFDTARGTVMLQAGCRLGELRAALAASAWRWHAEGADDEPIGAWLLRTRGWLPGRCADSGLEAAEVLLADGSLEFLGPFGSASTLALRTASGSRIVSGLFPLASSTQAIAMCAEPAWPAAFRLDALTPVAAKDGAPAPDPNPAHFLLGSRGALAWTGRLRLRLRGADDPPVLLAMSLRHSDVSGREMPSDLLDAQVKALFDSQGVFPPSVV
jgi:hypothetical protein